MNQKQPDLSPLLTALRREFGERVRSDEMLARHTTLQLGGPADLYFSPRTVDELVTAVTLARSHSIQPFLLGSGANLVVSNAGIRGLVIENRVQGLSFQDMLVCAESGVILSRLAKYCAEKRFSGLEWLVGVPGTVGGAVVNNAGAYGQAIGGILSRAELLLADGTRCWQPVDWFGYGYRSSRLKHSTENVIVLQAQLQLSSAPFAEIAARMQAYTERRRATQPPGATVGSMFKNPPGDYAGRLIEAAGLKGHRVGQAEISPIHANFFINLGGAQADDVIELIRIARETVAEKFGITLDLEIEIIA